MSCRHLVFFTYAQGDLGSSLLKNGWNPMAKKNLLNVIVAICTVCLGIVVISYFQGTAHAATSSVGACTLQTSPAGISETEVYEVSGYGPGTLTMSQTASVSNTLSGEVGFSVDAISAKVGASVTQSKSVTLSDSVAVPDGQFLKLIAWGVFNETLLTNTCGGEGVVDVFDHIEYQPLWNGNV
jgi:hypothetical protein